MFPRLTEERLKVTFLNKRNLDRTMNLIKFQNKATIISHQIFILKLSGDNDFDLIGDVKNLYF